MTDYQSDYRLHLATITQNQSGARVGVTIIYVALIALSWVHPFAAFLGLATVVYFGLLTLFEGLASASAERGCLNQRCDRLEQRLAQLEGRNVDGD